MSDASGKQEQGALTRRALTGLAKKFSFECVFLFVCAWTVNYWEAWVFLAVNLAALLPLVLYFLKHDPEFVRRRLKLGAAGESRPSQKRVMEWLKYLYLLLLIIPALDHRFGWSHVPTSIVISADFLILVGMAIQFRVFQENTFASAVIEVSSAQRVISTGPYAWVRHPMYSGAMLVSVATSIALGSWLALPIAGAKLLMIIARLKDEEKFLNESLPRYAEYCQTVPHRLIPYLW